MPEILLVHAVIDYVFMIQQGKKGVKWKNTASFSRNVSIQEVRKQRNRQSRQSMKKIADYKSSNKN
jgi:hypothetical protein